MFAVIKTGGKQYKVSKDDIISVEKLLGKPGDQIEIRDVLMLGEDGETPKIGSPLLENASITAEIIEQGRGAKIIVFKKKRRHNYRRKRGHRQDLTVIKVLEVNQAGTKAKAASKKSTTKKPAGKEGPKKEKFVDEEKTATKKAASTKKPSASNVTAKDTKNVKKAAPAKKASAKKPVAKKAVPKTKKSTDGDKD